MPYSAFQPLHLTAPGNGGTLWVRFNALLGIPAVAPGTGLVVDVEAVDCFNALLGIPAVAPSWWARVSCPGSCFNALLGIPAVAPRIPLYFQVRAMYGFNALLGIPAVAPGGGLTSRPEAYWFQCPTRHSSRCTSIWRSRAGGIGGSFNALLGIPAVAPGGTCRWKQWRRWFQCPTRHSSRCTSAGGRRLKIINLSFNALLGIPAVAPPQEGLWMWRGYKVSMPYSAFQPLHPDALVAVPAPPFRFQCPTRHSSRCTHAPLRERLERYVVSMPYSAFQPLHRIGTRWRSGPTDTVSMPYSAFQPLHPGFDFTEEVLSLQFQCPTRHSSRCTLASESDPLLDGHRFQCPTRHSSRCTGDRPLDHPRCHLVSMPYSAFQPLHSHDPRQGARSAGGFNALLGIPAVAPDGRQDGGPIRMIVSMPYSAFQPLHRPGYRAGVAMWTVSMPYSAFQPLHLSTLAPLRHRARAVSRPYSAFQPLHPHGGRRYVG